VKYLIVGHGDGNDGARVIVCETQEQREIQTIEEIYGENTFPNPSDCQDILTLRDEKIITFEGDPPLEWIDAADIVDSERDQLKAELAQAKAFLESEGYRRCDIPACNCGSYHGPSKLATVWQERFQDEHHHICAIGDVVFGIQKDAWSADAVSRETLAQLTALRALRAHNAALLEACEKDKARLDWLEVNAEPRRRVFDDWFRVGFNSPGGKTIRAAIDAAIALEKGEK